MCGLKRKQNSARTTSSNKRETTPPLKRALKDCIVFGKSSNTTIALFFFLKSTFRENIQAESPEKIRTSIRTCPASILGKNFLFSYLGQNLSWPLQNPIRFSSTSLHIVT